MSEGHPNEGLVVDDVTGNELELAGQGRARPILFGFGTNLKKKTSIEMLNTLESFDRTPNFRASDDARDFDVAAALSRGVVDALGVDSGE